MQQRGHIQKTVTIHQCKPIDTTLSISKYFQAVQRHTHKQTNKRCTETTKSTTAATTTYLPSAIIRETVAEMRKVHGLKTYSAQHPTCSCAHYNHQSHRTHSSIRICPKYHQQCERTTGHIEILRLPEQRMSHTTVTHRHPITAAEVAPDQGSARSHPTTANHDNSHY